MRILDWLNQNQGIVMTLLTVVYVLATLIIVWFTRKATAISQQNLDTAIQLEKNRSRPYLLFNITSSTSSRTTSALLKNVGLSAGYNVKVTLEPKLMFSDETDRESAITSLRVLFLPPGEEITDNLGSSPAFHQKYPDSTFQGSIEYEDISGQKYKEAIRLDLTYLKKRLYVKEPSIVEELSKINQSLEKISESMVPQNEI